VNRLLGSRHLRELSIQRRLPLRTLRQAADLGPPILATQQAVKHFPRSENQLPVAIFSWKTRISTRRFIRRPLDVLLSATGLFAP
jgi:hypothetical protein